MSANPTKEEIAELKSFASADIVKGERNPMMELTCISSETPSFRGGKENQIFVKTEKNLE